MLIFLVAGDENAADPKNLVHCIEEYENKAYLVSDMKTALYILKLHSLWVDAVITFLPLKLERKAFRVDPLGGIRLGEEARLHRPDLPLIVCAQKHPNHYLRRRPSFDYAFLPLPVEPDNLVITFEVLRG